MSERYAELFLSESREHLSTVNDALLVLERGGAPGEPVRELFRAVHSVKGMAAAMGFDAVAELAHALESVLDRVRADEREVTAELLDVLFAAADRLEEAVAAAIGGADGTVDCSAEVERLERLAAPTGSAAALEVRVRLAPETPLPGVRAFLVVRKAEAVGRVVRAEPPVGALQAGAFDGAFALWLDTTAAPETIVATIHAAGDVAEVQIVSASAAAPAPKVVPAPSDQPTSPAPPVAGASRPSGGQRGSGAQRASAARAGAGARSVRIEARRLDALLDLVGELVIARGRLLGATAGGDPTVRDAAGQVARLVGLLQEEVLTTRLVPVWQVFDRFPRLVRDAARTVGKEVEFVVEGKEIELDRSLLDEIGDPLVHLLRNAVDHGLETPDERRAAGKPAVGRLTLSAIRDRDAVLLRVADDGRGIDRERVAQRARELGLLAGSAALGDDDLVRLVSRAGFSTAERVTSLSGRGVGVDAVQARLRALGGSLEIATRAGVGTTVTMRLPLTLAIVRALLARVADETYVIPASHVAATAELASADRTSVRGEAALVLHGEALPALDLRDVVGLPDTPTAGREVVVLDVRERRVALLVDELVGQQDVVVKRFDTARGALSCFGGATVLADGAPALILDVGRLLN